MQGHMNKEYLSRNPEQSDVRMVADQKSVCALAKATSVVWIVPVTDQNAEI